MTYTINSMCEKCKRLGKDCDGDTNYNRTGCVYRQPARKMSELFTAYYSDRRTVYEKTYDEIRSMANGAGVEIRPTIWLWKAGKSNVFFVDYVGDGISATLKTFDTLSDATAYRNKIADMDEIQFERCFLSKEYKEM